MEGESRHTNGERDRPAAPEQPDAGFEEGLEQLPESPDERAEPNFARGLDEGHPDAKPGFGRGEEMKPGSRENEAERRFSEGLERPDGD
jgi:hypothetical protein